MNDLDASFQNSADHSLKKGLGMLAATLGGLLIISWIFSHWDLDRTIAARFYSSESGWFLKETNPWHWLYRYGTIPGIAFTLAALVGSVITRFRMPDSGWHRYFLLVVLTSILGAGLIVNGILKPYWGRPRPNQIRELGGQYQYRNALSPGIPGKGKSFPSGHATMGFIFVSLIYFHRKSRVVAWIGGIGGMVYGTLISITRVVQGAHFVTDCIWSLGIIWMVASAMYYFVLKIPAPVPQTPKPLTKKQRISIIMIGVLLSAAITMAFLTRRPYYETYSFHIGPIPPDIRELRVGLENGFARTSVRYTDQHPLLVLINAHGFAWTGAFEAQETVSRSNSGAVFRVIYRMKEYGYFAELTHDIEVVVPNSLRDRLRVVFVNETGKPISQ